ncbi:MAG TPA: metallophosphoesterase [Vicinamibacterales bacterium]|nr:metallophosphoesterase [Vicinamibacterales bacterium]
MPNGRRTLQPAAAACALAAVLCCAGAEPARSVAVAAPNPAVAAAGARQAQVPLPNKGDTLKFGAIGDNGDGDSEQYEIGKQMAAWRGRFPFELVVMLGDNIYGSDRPQDFVRKFEAPYKALLDAGVKFYASLGNHDSREQRFYKLFNMDGNLYYTFKGPKEDVRFFALESTYMDQDQLKWIEDELKKSNEKWKIVYFHHPLYGSARTHGSQLKLRAVLEPLFIQYNVSLVLNGHDHVYERIKPQNGIQYFVEGSSGKLRRGDLRPGSPLTAFGNDQTRTFMLMEIDGDHLTFNAVDMAGNVIDSGTITRRK